jgi:hypothetical protein
VVARGEVVALEAELADPDLGVRVVAAVGVEHPAAAPAEDGLVGEQGELRDGLQRRAHDAEGHDEAGGFDAGARPCVPHQAQALHALQLVEIHRSRGPNCSNGCGFGERSIRASAAMRRSCLLRGFHEIVGVAWRGARAEEGASLGCEVEAVRRCRGGDPVFPRRYSGPGVGIETPGI